LPEIVASFRELAFEAVALHRPPDATEVRALAAQAQRRPVVVLFGERAAAPAGIPLVVVEGGAAPSDPAEREQALEELCRRLHSREGPALAIRTPIDAAAFPSPRELPLLRGALPRIGYWHDLARGGEEYLESCGDMLCGASFDPFAASGLSGVCEALGDRALAVVALPCGTESATVREALAYAGSIFRG